MQRINGDAIDKYNQKCILCGCIFFLKVRDQSKLYGKLL